MKKIGDLAVGSRFCTANDAQVSMNELPMAPTTTYEVVKMFPVAPFFVVSVVVGTSAPKYTLSPETLVLAQGEPRPSEEEFARLALPRYTKKVVGYRVCWDGKSNLSLVLNQSAEAVARCIFALGRPEWQAKELAAAVGRHVGRFIPAESRATPRTAFYFAARKLVEVGVLTEIVAEDDTARMIREGKI
jgi:hypothetical protein